MIWKINKKASIHNKTAGWEYRKEGEENGNAVFFS